MKKIIIEMIRQAEEQRAEGNFDAYEYTCNNIYNILNELATTYNAPSDWRCLSAELAETYNNTRIFEDARLYEFI